VDLVSPLYSKTPQYLRRLCRTHLHRGRHPLADWIADTYREIVTIYATRLLERRTGPKSGPQNELSRVFNRGKPATQ
jgi:hypothetical protein